MESITKRFISVETNTLHVFFLALLSAIHGGRNNCFMENIILSFTYDVTNHHDNESVRNIGRRICLYKHTDGDESDSIGVSTKNSAEEM